MRRFKAGFGRKNGSREVYTYLRRKRNFAREHRRRFRLNRRKRYSRTGFLIFWVITIILLAIGYAAHMSH